MEKDLKKHLLKLLELYIRIPYYVHNLTNRNKVNFVSRVMMTACKSSENQSECYVTYRLRSKSMTNLPVLQCVNSEEETRIAIIMQGPLMLEDDFTLTTAIYYKKCYPNSKIIVSTWDDSDKTTIRQLREQGIIVVLSKLPDNSGNLNINYQVVSTLAGVKEAKRHNVEYVCKTRTDQRLYHPNAMNHLLDLVKTFPVNNDDFKEKQKGRIVTFCMPYGDLFYPYCLSDFLYFGYVEDVEQLFSIAPDKRAKGKHGNGSTRREIAETMRAPEIQLLRDYISRMGGNNACTIKAYWQFVKNHLITINKDEVGLFWPKYEERYCEHIRNGTYYPSDREDAYKCYNFDFIHWLSLHQGTMTYVEDYEKYIDYIL